MLKAIHVSDDSTSTSGQSGSTAVGVSKASSSSNFAPPLAPPTAKGGTLQQQQQQQQGAKQALALSVVSSVNSNQR